MTRPGKDTEQLAKLVTAYTGDPTLGNADEVLDVRSRCGRRIMGMLLTCKRYAVNRYATAYRTTWMLIVHSLFMRHRVQS